MIRRRNREWQNSRSAWNHQKGFEKFRLPIEFWIKFWSFVVDEVEIRAFGIVDETLYCMFKSYLYSLRIMKIIFGQNSLKFKELSNVIA